MPLGDSSGRRPAQVAASRLGGCRGKYLRTVRGEIEFPTGAAVRWRCARPTARPPGHPADQLAHSFGIGRPTGTSSARALPARCNGSSSPAAPPQARRANREPCQYYQADTGSRVDGAVGHRARCTEPAAGAEEILGAWGLGRLKQQHHRKASSTRRLATFRRLTMRS